MEELETLSNIDYISDLHDDLLYEIFCYLDYDDILRTSCLSKRWRHLWASDPLLSFSVRDMHSLSERNAEELADNYDDSYYDMAPERRRRLVNSVNIVLSIRKEEPVLGFFLSFRPIIVHQYEDEEEGEDHSACVAKWISMLQSTRVKYLDLDFSDNGYLVAENNPKYELPIQLFHIGGLTELALTYCRLPLMSSIDCDQCVALKSLTVLNLGHVFISDTDMNEHILPNATLLETLVLHECHDLTRLHIPPQLLKLKTLNVTDCFRLDEIKTDSPNLEAFYYEGQLIKFSVSQLAPLTKVSLRFISGFADKHMPEGWFTGRPHHDLTCILRMLPSCLPYVEELDLSVHGLKLMVPNKECIPDQKLVPTYGNQLKVFKWSIVCVHEVDFCYLMHILRTCPSLEELWIYFIEVTTTLKPNYEDMLHESKKEIWVPPAADSIQLGSIKTIDICGFTAEKNQMELSRFLLNKCSSTPSFTIEPCHYIKSWSKEVGDHDIDDFHSKARVELLSTAAAASQSSPKIVFLPLDIWPQLG